MLFVNVMVPHYQNSYFENPTFNFVILLIVGYPLVLWQVSLFIPFCNYIIRSLFIFNHITSCFNKNLVFSACGILDFYNLHYNLINGIFGVSTLALGSRPMQGLAKVRAKSEA